MRRDDRNKARAKYEREALERKSQRTGVPVNELKRRKHSAAENKR